MFFQLAYKSLLNRKSSVFFTLMAMSVSIFVLLGVEQIRNQVKSNFTSSVSGIDLIVGARSGGINLLLYSVFRIGNPTNNITWNTYKTLSEYPQVDWSVPISLGDSHQGFRVIGTTEDYFKHFSYGKGHSLSFDQGKPFSQLFDLVLGYDVAKKLGYQLGDELVLSHGISSNSLTSHKDKPFQVVGILKPTHTAVDQGLYISLLGLEAMHLGWKNGVQSDAPTKSLLESAELLRKDALYQKLQPKEITAFLVGLKSRMTTFELQRNINQYKKEPLTALLPGVALSELWQIMGILENTLRLIASLVLLSALLGLCAMLLASIKEREQEIQLLRIIGAGPCFLFFLIQMEAIMIGLLSILFASLTLSAVLHFCSDWVTFKYGIQLTSHIFSANNLKLLTLIIIATSIVASLPALRFYRSAILHKKI